MDYVLIAERSLKEIVPVTLASLRRYGRVRSVGLIVPNRDLELFASLADPIVTVIPESLVLPNWPLAKVADRLVLRHRAGWYLQQFLKFSYGEYAGLQRYLIWDADTILLREIAFSDNGSTRVNLAKEHHEPYFETYRRLTGRQPVLEKSAISQYLMVETEVIEQLTRLVCERTHSNDWIDGVLRSLPGLDPSEFSEYETYVNFLAGQSPNRIIYAHERWFRYGTEILPPTRWQSLPDKALDHLERLFSDYSYVAFERHPSRWLKRAAAHLFNFLRIGS